MSANAYLLDALTRHQIFLERFGGGELKKLKPILVQMRKDLAERIALDSLTADQLTRVEMAIRDIDAIITGATSALKGQLTADMTELYAYETGFSERLMAGTVNVQWAGVSVEIAAAAVTTAKFSIVSGQDIDRLTIDQMIAQFDSAVKRDVSAVIRAGAIEGKTTQQITREVMQLTNNRTQQQADALVRTVTQGIASEARSRTYAANADLLEGERWSATLDGRTSKTCMALSGKVFPINQGPTAPAHYRCRSVRVPVLKKEYQLDIKGATRASYRGPVSANITFDGWLKDQPADFQREMLGDARYKLFSKGGLKLERFADERGVVYTLDDLKRLEPMAFEKAGV